MANDDYDLEAQMGGLDLDSYPDALGEAQDYSQTQAEAFANAQAQAQADALAARQVQAESRSYLKSAARAVKNAVTRPTPDSTSKAEDVANVATTLTAFGATVKDYAGNVFGAEVALDVVNAATNLGTAVSEFYWGVEGGEARKNPYYFAANVTGSALGLARLGIDLSKQSGLENAKFGIDVAQMAVQVAKWGTKPSEKKAKGKEFESLSRQVSDLESQLSRASSRIGASAESSRSRVPAPRPPGRSKTAPVAGPSRNLPEQGESHRDKRDKKGKKKA
ncbi:hypothetical protein E0H26_14320 [Micromonospora zingiberis]|uniref:Uncharacterized protein n=1 Tax=Micromonospora zingiberis TaxID=2053011 RepID=A0A4R0GHF7_9ACTN|nr:hypothetical protein [Micromonospora zingiberis]TCB96790.1 hypothetical protein E0H26_14320 [Micromonospora zingiberis]